MAPARLPCTAADADKFLNRFKQEYKGRGGGSRPQAAANPSRSAAAARGSDRPVFASPPKASGQGALFSSSPGAGRGADRADGAAAREMVQLRRRLGEVSAEVEVLEEGNQALLSKASEADAAVRQLEDAAARAEAEREGASAALSSLRLEAEAAERQADEAERACGELEREIAELRAEAERAEAEAAEQEQAVEREVSELREAAAAKEDELRRAIRAAEAAEADARSRSSALMAQADEVDELRREAAALRSKLQGAGAYTLHRALALTVKENREAMDRLRAEAGAIGEEAVRVSSELERATTERDEAHANLRAAALAAHRTSAREAAAARRLAAAEEPSGEAASQMQLGGVELARLKQLAPEEAEAWAARAHKELARTAGERGSPSEALGLSLREAQRVTEREAGQRPPRSPASAGSPAEAKAALQRRREELRRELEELEGRIGPGVDEVQRELEEVRRQRAQAAE